MDGGRVLEQQRIPQTMYNVDLAAQSLRALPLSRKAVISAGVVPPAPDWADQREHLYINIAMEPSIMELTPSTLTSELRQMLPSILSTIRQSGSLLQFERAHITFYADANDMDMPARLYRFSALTSSLAIDVDHTVESALKTALAEGSGIIAVEEFLAQEKAQRA